MTINEAWIRRVAWTLVLICMIVFGMQLILNMTQVLKAMDFDRVAAAAFYGLLLAGLLFAWRRGHISHTAGTALGDPPLYPAGGSRDRLQPGSYRERPSEFLKKMSDNSDIVEFIRQVATFRRLEIDDQEIPYNFNDWDGIDSLNGYLASLTTNIGQVQGDYRVRMVFGVNLWVGEKPLRENQQELFTGTSGMKVYRIRKRSRERGSSTRRWAFRTTKCSAVLQKYDLE